MSTQPESGIEFSVTPEDSRRHFRLLELPADLLSLITSDDPPVLQLKSQEGPPGSALASTAVLCTPDQTYTLRQVSTSNEVYLAQSLLETDKFPPQSRLEAIAICDSTLELQPANYVSAIPYIRAALPVFTTTGLSESKEPISRAQLFANIPLSDAECQKAWQDLACFELSNPHRSLIPSNSTWLKVWQAILTSATAQGIDLTQSLETHDVSSIGNKYEEWPAPLTIAVIRSVCTTEDNNSTHFHVDGSRCALTTGKMLLQDLTENGRSIIPLLSFTAAWADLLPENWRSHAEIKVLEGSYVLEKGGQDVNFVESNVMDGSTGSVDAVGDGKATLGAKRKWHEKFRASKKTG